MNFDLVLLLPIIAVGLTVLFPIFKTIPYAAKSIKSRRRRKILLGRLTVFVLPVAAMAALISPVPDTSNIVKGLLFSAAVLIPALLVYTYLNIRYKSHRYTDSDIIARESGNGTDNAADNADNIDEIKDSVSAEQLSSRSSSHRAQINPIKPDAQDLPSINLGAEPASTAATSAKSATQPAAAPSLLMKERAPAASTASTAEGTDSPAEVQEQLDRVSDLIDSHDLGNSDYSLSDDDLEQRRFSLSTDVPLSIDSALATVDKSTTELSKMSTTQISELVTTLRTDKTRLQKLVIAQQASIESERKAHDQSRVVARDAIKIMRDARNGQKFAEKLARRERAERKRVEQQYKKVATALDNAMSIIESRKDKVSS